MVWYLSPALAQLGSVALPPRSPAAENDPLALDVLATIPVENEHGVGYDRDLFFEGLDEDGDGCRTRSEVLIRDSLVSPTISGVCRVKAGRWLSVYDGVTVTDPTALEVDHVVALEEAWDSGAWQWHDMRRASFANDLLDSRTLRPVTSATNQAKGNADPSNWIPPNESYVCTFLSDWIAIKARWGLTMDQSEAGRLRNLLTERCADQTVAPWPAAEPWPPSETPVPSTPVTTTTTTPAIVPLIGRGCDAAYPEVCLPPPPPDLDCRDIPDRRFTVLAPDPHNFDGDFNGVGCER